MLHAMYRNVSKMTDKTRPVNPRIQCGTHSAILWMPKTVFQSMRIANKSPTKLSVKNKIHQLFLASSFLFHPMLSRIKQNFQCVKP